MNILQFSWQLLLIFVFGVVVYIGVILVKAMKKYLKSSELRNDKEVEDKHKNEQC